MEFIPRTVGELCDYLGYVFLSAPDFDGPDIPGMTLERAFAVVRESLTALRSKLGESGHDRLFDAVGTAEMRFAAGDDAAGCHILQHMQEYLRLKKFSTDEPVIDGSRFSN